jgi:hypothetical protein
LPVHVMMTSGAQHHPVGQVGAATMGPPHNMVGFTMFGWGMTLRTPPIPLNQC